MRGRWAAKGQNQTFDELRKVATETNSKYVFKVDLDEVHTITMHKMHYLIKMYFDIKYVIALNSVGTDTVCCKLDQAATYQGLWRL